MSTIVAQSVRGALRTWMSKNRPPIGSLVSVKQRGVGDWADFKITR